MAARRVFISYRTIEPDLSVSKALYAALRGSGHAPFMAAMNLSVGDEWSRAIDDSLQHCDDFVVVLSERSVVSDMLIEEIRTAAELRKRHGGRHPRLLPVHLGPLNEDALPYRVRAALSGIQHIAWLAQADTPAVAKRLLDVLAEPDEPRLSEVSELRKTRPVLADNPEVSVDPTTTDPADHRPNGAKWWSTILTPISPRQSVLLTDKLISRWRLRIFSAFPKSTLALISLVLFFIATHLLTPTMTQQKLVISTVRALDKTFPAVLDVIVRNGTGSETIIHRIDLIILEVQPESPREKPYGVPVSMQYNALINGREKEVHVDVAQGVPSGRVDRFWVALGFGDEISMPGPWGDKLLEHISYASIASVRMRLRLVYNEGREVESGAFTVRVAMPPLAFKAKKTAGTTMDEKVKLLADPDINVEESVVELLGVIGGRDGFAALSKLQNQDLSYLRDYYSKAIYGQVNDPNYFSLPTPDERFRRFRNTLAKTISSMQRQ